VLPPEGAQVVRDGRIAGRVTSARVSERVGGVIGLAWVGPESAEEGAAISIRVDGTAHPATVTLSPFYDPEGALLRS
jgi:dimethylglycine dehydrogenase